MTKVEVKQLQEEMFGNAYLPSICIDIRMAIRGSSDPMPIEDYLKSRYFLSHILKTWDENDDEFDNAIKTIVIHTIGLLDKELGDK